MPAEPEQSTLKNEGVLNITPPFILDAKTSFSAIGEYLVVTITLEGITEEAKTAHLLLAELRW